MPDTPVFPITALLAASRARSYRERTIGKGRALLRFLESNGLARTKLLSADGQPDPRRDIYEGDLTNEGVALVRSCLYRWFDAQDRGKDVSDTRLLENELAKLRSGRSSGSGGNRA